MPTYSFTCPSCGAFELVRTIARRAEPAHCPTCDRIGARRFGAPHLSGLDRALDRAVTGAGLSSETPQVTRSIPPTYGVPARSSQPVGYPALPRP